MAAFRNLSTGSLLNHKSKTPQKHGVSEDGTISKTSTASTRPISVLFVCGGNICRSPMAEGVLRSLTASDQRLGRIESCGTGAYNDGYPPDPRTMSTLQDNGIGDYGHVARKVTAEDLNTFDYILAMDNENVHDLSRLKTQEIKKKNAGTSKEKLSAKVMLFGDFGGKKGEQVADPYYGDTKGFAVAYEQILRFSHGFVAQVLDAPK
ncbi:low molecular weight phosphotyrosine protein phosphatase, partial [Lecanoromycetidae sp. Uapishka_2]